MELYCIPRVEELDEFYSFSRDYNVAFEYNEFFIPDVLMKEEVKEQIIASYKALDRDRSRDTLHGAFLDIVVNSVDPEIYAISKKRVYQCMDIARELGIKGVIFHTNYIANFKLESYRSDWVERNEKFWRQVLLDYPELIIYMENMFDDAPDMLCELAKRMKDEERFGVCLDFAHAFVSGTEIGVWVDKLKPYIKHIHINDNNGTEDSHSAIGKGEFPWHKLKGWMSMMEREPSILIEVRSCEDFKESAKFLKEQVFFA